MEIKTQRELGDDGLMTEAGYLEEVNFGGLGEYIR